MRKLTCAELRALFLAYFEKQGHVAVPSSSLVPHNDATLLFTNAGMVPFKDVFLGIEKRDYRRAVSAQRCVRAGGKHNDLENVGYTSRHHTFFEMLGNFSFGDYFKREAVRYAWEFLTEILKLPKEKLWITVYSEDHETADIWRNDIGLPAERILFCGEADNFWSMGDTGPCGPCTEIYYDHGSEISGGLPGTADAEGDRYVEIWNLVFMQYDRKPDGALMPLPKPSVDTGMGLERVAAVLQGVHSNYDTDIFQDLIHAAAKLLKNYKASDIPTLRVIADHIRSSAFLIMDGVRPSNEGRGYVLRRIIRRALRHGHQSGFESPFFYHLVAPLVEIMGEAYPELRRQQAFIEKTLLQEENQFAQTLSQGLHIFENALRELGDQKTIPGEIIFKLYDTYGFPVDLTADLARERGLLMDNEGFDWLMIEQRQQSQAQQKFSSQALMTLASELQARGIAPGSFMGYEVLRIEKATILYIQKDSAGKTIGLVLDSTPFYTESGGQVSDQGQIFFGNSIFKVTGVVKIGQYILHQGEMAGNKALTENMQVTAEVDVKARQATALNHSATHLLHAALRLLLGKHVNQKGSLVTPERLRFDFSHEAALTSQECVALENLVNAKIRENIVGEIVEMSPDEAIQQGAVALFGEKYGDRVRTLRFADFSYEVCGGTHVRRTGDIGLFKIIAETGVAAGVRRIEAVTGERALSRCQEDDLTISCISGLLKTAKEDIIVRIQQLLEQQKQLQKQIAQWQGRLATQYRADLLQQVQTIGNIRLLTARMDGADNKLLKETIDQLKEKLGSAIIVLAATANDKAQLICGVTKDLINICPANSLVDDIAKKMGGKGGGRADMAQAGVSHAEGIDEALVAVAQMVQARLGQNLN